MEMEGAGPSSFPRRLFFCKVIGGGESTGDVPPCQARGIGDGVGARGSIDTTDIDKLPLLVEFDRDRQAFSQRSEGGGPLSERDGLFSLRGLHEEPGVVVRSIGEGTG